MGVVERFDRWNEINELSRLFNCKYCGIHKKLVEKRTEVL